MTHTDILKYALALGEQKIIHDKTNRIVYVPDVDINDKWLGINMFYADIGGNSGVSMYYSFDYENESEQDEITQNLIDFVIDYIETNDDANYEVREDFP